MKCKEHLEQSNTSYAEHLQWAVVAGLKLIYGGVASLIHAIYPAWFTGTSARIVIELYHQRLLNHPNKEYQQYINQIQSTKNHNNST